MEFWKKLNGVSAVALGVTLVAAALAVVADSSNADPYSRTAAALWLGVGLASTVGLAALTLFGERLLGRREQLERYRVGLIAANVVWVAGLVSTTGIERPYWVLSVAPLLIAAVSMSRLRSFAIGLFATLALGVAVLASGRVDSADAGYLVLILPLGPGITWFVALL